MPTKVQKKKLLETKAAIWFDKMCRIKNINPRYINITAKGNNEQSIKAKKWPQRTGSIKTKVCLLVFQYILYS